MPTRPFVAVAVAAGAALPVGVLSQLPASAGSVPSFPACHNDSDHVNKDGKPGRSPDHLGPGSLSGDNAYYYITITAGCGERAGAPVALATIVQLKSVISGALDANGMCWRIDVDLGYNHRPLAGGVLMGTKVEVTFPFAIAGARYRIRIANVEPGLVVSDHATVDG